MLVLTYYIQLIMSMQPMYLIDVQQAIFMLM